VHHKAKHFQRNNLNFNNMAPSLHSLPVELVYRILDNLDDKTILISCRDVCTRLNEITDTYHRYQVILGFTIKSHFHHLYNRIVLFVNMYINYFHDTYHTAGYVAYVSLIYYINESC
jgi:hypothetical protein